jgi:hypothetical protein
MPLFEHNRVLLARGKFSPSGNETTIPVPASGATVTLFDSTLNGNKLTPIPVLPFERLQINLYSSHDSAASGVVFSSDFDGGNATTPSSNFRQQSTQSFTNATGAATWDYLVRGGHAKVTYQNSANTLTAWEVEVYGVYDRNPGS